MAFIYLFRFVYVSKTLSTLEWNEWENQAKNYKSWFYGKL
jgi:hypothetical protein